VSQPTSQDPNAVPRAPHVLHGRSRIGAPLPTSLTSFVGREREIQELATLLRRPEVRLVTVTGPAGVGKTRLALKVAEELAAGFGDGVAFIDLTTATTPDLVAPMVAQALGMRETGDRALEDRLIDTLRDRHLLLVVDNFEPVVVAAPLIARILAGCQGLKALVTSRESMSLAAEWRVQVPALTLPDPAQPHDTVSESEALRLFVERAQAAQSDFDLTEGNIHSIIGILQRVEGLPLAIELAAARLTHLPPTTLLQRLDRRLPLLIGGARDLPERQRTLRGAIGWSYDLLTPEEQGVLRQLAVFAGGCTLEAAEATAVGNGRLSTNVIDIVASLVSKSLLKQDVDYHGGARFSMLEVVREYGLEQMAEIGEEQVNRNRHAAYFVELAERADPAIWGGPKHGWWLDQLETEFANLRVALVWLQATGDDAAFVRLAAALGGLWHYRSHRVEGRAWLNRALAANGETVPLARAMAFIKLGMLERVLGGSHAADFVMQGLALRQEQGDQRGSGRALMNLGNVLKDRGEYERAVPILEEAAAVLETVGDIGGLATTRMYLGMAALDQGDPVRAHALLTDALALHHQDGFEYGVSATLLALGRIEAERGDMVGAARRYAESLHLWTQVKSREGFADAIAATAALAMTCGHPGSAARLLGASSATAEALGYVPPQRDRERYERVARAVRTSLGERLYRETWDTGRMLSPTQAMVEATGVLTTVGRQPTPGAEIPADSALLTPREQDVLRLLANGLTNRDIADALFVSPRTINSHIDHILTKLDVRSRTAAVAFAVRNGLA
jgi:predicted ATPase/DNA-binding CsgD family transcriptional regulator